MYERISISITYIHFASLRASLPSSLAQKLHPASRVPRALLVLMPVLSVHLILCSLIIGSSIGYLNAFSISRWPAPLKKLTWNIPEAMAMVQQSHG